MPSFYILTVMADFLFYMLLNKYIGDYIMETIEKLWLNGDITNKGAMEAAKARKALQTFEKALLYYNTSDLSWKKCIKKAQSEIVENPMWRDL